MLAVHLENLLFLLLLLVAGLFQLLGRAARKTSEGEEKPTSKPLPRMLRPIPRASTQSDEERIRKFMEALGQPSSRPPPPAVPRTHIPPRPLAPVQPPIPPLWQLTREELRKRREILKEGRSSETLIRVEEIAVPAKTDASGFEVHEAPLPLEPPPIIKTPQPAYAPATGGVAKAEQPKPHVAGLLVSTSGLREAIVLREILGPPRGLQTLDLL
jgi:hypothetical protein